MSKQPMVEYETVVARVEWRESGAVITGYTYPGTVRHGVIWPRDHHQDLDNSVRVLERAAEEHPEEEIPYSEWREWLTDMASVSGRFREQEG